MINDKQVFDFIETDNDKIPPIDNVKTPTDKRASKDNIDDHLPKNFDALYLDQIKQVKNILPDDYIFIDKKGQEVLRLKPLNSHAVFLLKKLGYINTFFSLATFTGAELTQEFSELFRVCLWINYVQDTPEAISLSYHKIAFHKKEQEITNIEIVSEKVDIFIKVLCDLLEINYSELIKQHFTKYFPRVTDLMKKKFHGLDFSVVMLEMTEQLVENLTEKKHNGSTLSNLQEKEKEGKNLQEKNS